MKIMCLNGWGGKLHAPLTAYLGASSPDILCLQEVVHSPETTKEWLTYRDGSHVLPQRANMFRDVARVLPDHTPIFCPAAQGVLWDGASPIPSQWGLATFVRRTLPITGQVQGFVHKAFSPDGYGEHPRSRSAHIVRVFDFEKAQFICVAHMHGLRDLKGKADTPERIAQANRLAELVQQIAEPNDPVVVCGDFNVEPGSRMFEILGRIGLVDLVTARGFGSTRTSHYSKAGKFADYMFVNSHVNVAEFTVITEPEVSDHCPLILTL